VILPKRDGFYHFLLGQLRVTNYHARVVCHTRAEAEAQSRRRTNESVGRSRTDARDFDNDAQFLLPLRWLFKFMLPKIFSEILDRFFVMEVTMRLSLS
jgi:hypothetical protein